MVIVTWFVNPSDLMRRLAKAEKPQYLLAFLGSQNSEDHSGIYGEPNYWKEHCRPGGVCSYKD